MDAIEFELPIPVFPPGRKRIGTALMPLRIAQRPLKDVGPAIRQFVPHHRREHIETTVWNGERLMHPVYDSDGKVVTQVQRAFWMGMRNDFPREYPFVDATMPLPIQPATLIPWEPWMGDTLAGRVAAHAAKGMESLDGIIYSETVGPTFSVHLSHPYDDLSIVWSTAGLNHAGLGKTSYRADRMEQMLEDVSVTGMVPTVRERGAQAPDILMPEALDADIDPMAIESAAATIVQFGQRQRLSEMARSTLEGFSRVKSLLYERDALTVHAGSLDLWRRSVFDLRPLPALDLGIAISDPEIYTGWHRTHRVDMQIVIARVDRMRMERSPGALDDFQAASLHSTLGT